MMKDIQKLLGLTYSEMSASDIVSGFSIPQPESIDLDSYVEMPNEGVSFILPRGTKISGIHLYSAGRDGYNEFAGCIPKGLQFSMSQEEVRRLMGQPLQSGDAVVDPIMGDMPAWDKFDLGDYFVHVEYALAVDRIGLITLLAKNL
ncbi:DUF6392 family protein [Sorangium sp. So ce315]|uniref:DUF6392 family protein n=1 Tax=Sorangium sp. So ce315 TaxID=3133299 RepID=UPI003F5E66E1